LRARHRSSPDASTPRPPPPSPRGWLNFAVGNFAVSLNPGRHAHGMSAPGLAVVAARE
jgi:hypothetical protein